MLPLGCITDTMVSELIAEIYARFGRDSSSLFHFMLIGAAQSHGLKSSKALLNHKPSV